jgi:hypothetical protein
MIKDLGQVKIIIWMSQNTKSVQLKIHILRKCNFYGFIINHSFESHQFPNCIYSFCRTYKDLYFEQAFSNYRNFFLMVNKIFR